MGYTEKKIFLKKKIDLFLRPGVHVADRETGRRFSSLPHVLASMGRPFGIVAIPNECRQGQFSHYCIPKFVNLFRFSLLFSTYMV